MFERKTSAVLILILAVLSCAGWAQDVRPDEATIPSLSPRPAKINPIALPDGDGGGGSPAVVRPAVTPAPTAPAPEGFQWRPAFTEAFSFLMIQHGFRLLKEPGTRTGLKGPFLRDWMDSVKGVEGWRDGDPFYVNYVGHPMQGAITGLVQVQNDPHGRNLQFNDPGYWKSRSKAMIFSAAYSAQFELGPISEASIGNVGREMQANGYTGAGAVDFVVTPTVGTMMLIGEDVVDRYAILRLENRTSNRFLKAMIRTWLNPNRAMANILRGEYPWHRDTRPGINVSFPPADVIPRP